MPGSAQTAHHKWPVMASTDEVRLIRDHVTGLAAAQDTEIPKITFGTGAPPATGNRNGDIFCQYSLTALLTGETSGDWPVDE